MEKRASIAPFFLVLVLAAGLQVALVAADTLETPVKVAKNFVKAYYLLDPGMKDLLCSDIAGDQDRDVVGDYIYGKITEARQRGLAPGCLRQMLYDMHVEIIEESENEATVHLTATGRVCINPVFATVARIFAIGNEYPVEATLRLVRQDGKWRVCGNPFGLNPRR